jgi:hypothetical protein
MTVRLETTRVGTNWVVRSPDVPELFVAHADRDVAESNVPAALAMIERMKERVAARKAVQARRKASVAS